MELETDGAGDEAGFVLVDVLVAFAVLSLVLVAMLRAFSGTTGIVVAVAAREARFELAEELLATYRSRSVLNAGIERGTSDGVSWWVDIAEVPSAGLPRSAGTARPLRLSIGVDPTALPGQDTRQPPALLTSLVLAIPADE